MRKAQCTMENIDVANLITISHNIHFPIETIRCRKMDKICIMYQTVFNCLKCSK